MTPGSTEGSAPPSASSHAPDEVVLAKLRVPHTPSMPLERLDALLDGAHRHRLVLVVAPAGSGKTTLLARLATRMAADVVAWYRAEAWDRDERSLVRHLEAALLPQVSGAQAGWRSVADVANALEAWRGGRALLLIDDLHALEGTEAEQALGRIIDYAPATLTVAAASRVPPGFNLPRLRVSGDLLEITSEDLRFRSWEVERLFRDFYGEPLPPEELARLARRTEGWAAGLQLFHLATRGRAPDERQRVLAALGSGARLMRDYLTRNVVDQLPPDLRTFLVQTSVLGRLSGPLCDRFLGLTGSRELLAELERRTLFTQALAEDGVFRYHEVLRSYLQGVLLDEVGEERARELYRRAGQLLAEEEALPEALEAYCRAEDWRSAQALLGRDGGEVAGMSSSWLDALPPTVLRHDPWLLLASARRMRSEGRWPEAVSRYQQAQVAFAGTGAAHVCQDERQAILAWLEPGHTAARQDWAGLLRAALTREPLAAARRAAELEADAGPLVSGLALLVAGHLVEARDRLQSLSLDEQASPMIRAAAYTADGIAALLAGQPQGRPTVEGAASYAESLGFEWLARLGRASLALTGDPESLSEADAVALACDAAGDRWGAALARLFATWGAVIRRDRAPDVEPLLGEFRALGTPVLEAWVRGLHALHAAGEGLPEAVEAARGAEAAARAIGLPAAQVLNYLALAECQVSDSVGYAELAEATARECGLDLSRWVSPPKMPTQPPVPTGAARVAAGKSPLRLVLFGGFRLELSGAIVDLGRLRPRVRSLVRLLSLHADTPVHHETIEAALWPDAAGPIASRNLHVAVAELRRLLEPHGARGDFRLVRREGDAYRLVVPPGGEVDVQLFGAAIAAGRAAGERGDAIEAQRSLADALNFYRGELLPEEGPAEWVAEQREVLRLSAVQAAQSLAELMLAGGDAQAAAQACARGLAIERYDDPLWRLLIKAREMAGDQGAATKARLGYEEMLAGLGVGPTAAVADQRLDSNSTSRRAISGSPSVSAS